VEVEDLRHIVSIVYDVRFMKYFIKQQMSVYLYLTGMCY